MSDFLIALLAGATIAATITNVLQLAVAWVTLREIGDLDKDRTDWFEKAPWRKYGPKKKKRHGKS